jgi:hypothetical protein
MIPPQPRPIAETQIDLRAAMPCVTQGSEERSKNTDTESPVNPKSSPQGEPSASPEDSSRYSSPLVARSKSSVELCPRQSKLALQPSSGWKGNKGPRARREQPARLPCHPLPTRLRENASFVPCRLLSGWALGWEGSRNGF